MLQITPTANTATWATLSVEGLIVAEWVQVLQRECRQRMDSGCSVVLDLDGVSSIDYAGVLMLRALPRSHVEIVNASPLIRALLAVGEA